MSQRLDEIYLSRPLLGPWRLRTRTARAATAPAAAQPQAGAAKTAAEQWAEMLAEARAAGTTQRERQAALTRLMRERPGVRERMVAEADALRRSQAEVRHLHARLERANRRLAGMRRRK